MSAKPEEGSVSEETWARLAAAAWDARSNARIFGNTQVGAGVLSAEGGIFKGCNVEHRFRSHDVHAEVNALVSMVAAGHMRAVAVVIASERENFTPCGACMDWIFELGGADCIIAVQGSEGGRLDHYRADELMPYYPF
jgi:cytidine deaminase